MSSITGDAVQQSGFNALDVSGLVKAFGTTKAVRGITFNVRKGEILGLLGPNGSGKSTTMKLVLGILKPDAGTVIVYGRSVAEDPIEVKNEMGYVPETPQIYEFLSGVEYLDFVGDMYSMAPAVKKERINQFLQALDLNGHENEMIGSYSQGMKQKIAITAALMNRPKLLIADEVLNGLDPRSARIVKDLLRNLAKEGVSILFSTHVLEIAEAICDKVVIMSQGTILAEGAIPELKKRAGLPGSTLEDIFLKITGTEDLREVAEALSR
ncbi:MAG: ABC transporter ATP-binding protein [Thaumarchaeota archaeon]|nr:ABC transporter ATP-binding protein [Nitrososphaerota archaeon]